jgi:hypothetical protein
MTPKELVEIHVGKHLHLDPSESIEYSLAPDYEGACTSHGFEVNDDDVCYGYYWDKTAHSDDRDYFDSEKEAWINCAEANSIEPYYLQPVQDIVVSEWLYDQLLKHGQPVAIYKNINVWGRPGHGIKIYQEYVIQQIALGN